MRRPADALTIARGEVRDGAAAIDHFREVLASRRVGPKVLARAVPEMEAGCAPLSAALTAASDAVAAELADDTAGAEAVRALLAHADARVRELGEALGAHRGTAMDARARLSLEAVVRSAAGELSTVVRLLDLLGAPVTSETTTIDFADALAARRAAQRPGATMVRASVEQRARELTVGDARMILELLEHAVATVARAGVTAPRIVVDTGAEGFARFVVDAGGEAEPAGRAVFEIALREELPREQEVVAAAARHAGITLSVSDGGRAVTIAL